MKTISMTAWRRPDYERQVVNSIGEALRPDWRWFQKFTDAPAGPQNRGVDANTLYALQAAFAAGSDFNLHVEDDTVLSPDALDLCDWFYEHPERDNYAMLVLHWMSRSVEKPLDVLEDARFCPWGWAITRGMWERYFLPEWGGKHRVDPKGWDWSMSLTLQRHGLKVLRPSLSRTRNIGREGGTYETPEHWDSWATDLVHSPGGFGKDFRITDRIVEMPPVEDWAVEEMGLE